MKKVIIFLIIVAVFACKKKDMHVFDSSYQPDISAAKFPNSTQVTNPYLPFEAGKTYIFEGNTSDGLERIELKRLATFKTVAGIVCIVVNDKAWLNDVLIEDTDDWFAQDIDGNVWYFGEAVKNYDANGVFKDNAGSWEAGVDGAQPGIVMLAHPTVGTGYRQEYYFNEAEDEAEILEIGLTVTVPYGNYNDCIKTHDFTVLEASHNEQKFYAPGIGVIKELDVETNEIVELIDIQ